MSAITIFDPPQSCATGGCSPDTVDEAALFDEALAWVAAQGVHVARHNLGLEPEAFAANPLVKGMLRQEGLACLPLVMAGGAILAKGRYPSREDLAAGLGLAVTSG
jgi:hypothetical protein